MAVTRFLPLVLVLLSASFCPAYQRAPVTPDWPGEFHFCGTNARAPLKLTFRLRPAVDGPERTAVRSARLEFPARILFKHQQSDKVFVFDLREIAWMDVAYSSFYFGWAGKGVGDDQETARAFAVHMGYKARQIAVLRLKLRDGAVLEGDPSAGVNYILLTDPRVKMYGDRYWDEMKDMAEAAFWKVKSVVNWVNTWPLFPWAAAFLKACEIDLGGKYTELKVTVADLSRIEVGPLR
jgi:hypothetical protein